MPCTRRPVFALRTSCAPVSSLRLDAVVSSSKSFKRPGLAETISPVCSPHWPPEPLAHLAETDRHPFKQRPRSVSSRKSRTSTTPAAPARSSKPMSHTGKSAEYRISHRAFAMFTLDSRPAMLRPRSASKPARHFSRKPKDWSIVWRGARCSRKHCISGEPAIHRRLYRFPAPVSSALNRQRSKHSASATPPHRSVSPTCARRWLTATDPHCRQSAQPGLLFPSY